MELDNASRGAVLDLPAVVSAAEKTAHAEDNAIFNGFKAGGIEGIIPTTSHPAIAIPDDYADYPSVVVDAVETLRRAGINGPYALALGPNCYAGLAQAAQDGYPIRERVEHFLDGPMVLAPKVDGAVLLSHRGGDFQLSVGQDLSIGYAGSRQGQGLPLPDRVVRLPRPGAHRGGVPQTKAPQEVGGMPHHASLLGEI